MTGGVRDARPPRAVVRIFNPVLKVLLRTAIGRAIRPLALIEFDGRRTGRHISVVVGWHAVDGSSVVFTPAPWRSNFARGAAATVIFRGRHEPYEGTLEDDPTVVASSISEVLRAGTSPRALGLHIPEGHTITADDVVRTGRAMLRFRPTPPT